MYTKNDNIFENINHIKIYSIFLAVLFCCHYLFILKYTLYEDDFVFATFTFSYPSLPDLLIYIQKCFLSWPQGRPLGFAFPATISWLLGKTGYVFSLYIVGFFIIFFNTCILYKILCYITNKDNAIIGALIYITFPADTTKILLTHAIQIQPGIFCCLIAILLYQRERERERMRVYFSYCIASLSLLFYETTFLPFLFAIILTKNINIKKAIIHFGICFGIICLYTLIRSSMGEERLIQLSNTSFLYTIYIILKNMCKGMVAIPYSYCRSVKILISDLNIMAITFTSAFYIILFYFTRSFKYPKIYNIPIILGTIIIFPSSYLLSFTHEVWVFSGRMTSVHISASVAFAFVVTLFLQNSGRIYYILKIISLLFIAISIGKSILVSHSYAEMSKLQKSVYAVILDEAKDIEPSDIIIIDCVSGKFQKYLPYIKRQINPFSWSESIAYSLMITKGNENYKPKMLAPLYRKEDIRYNGYNIEIYNYGPPEYGSWIPCNSDHLIYYQLNDNSILRKNILPDFFGLGPIPLKEITIRTQPRYPLNEDFLHFIFGKNFTKTFPLTLKSDYLSK